MLLPLAHITLADVGIAVGLFFLGVLVGAALVSRLRDAVR